MIDTAYSKYSAQTAFSGTHHCAIFFGPILKHTSLPWWPVTSDSHPNLLTRYTKTNSALDSAHTHTQNMVQPSFFSSQFHILTSVTSPEPSIAKSNTTQGCLSKAELMANLGK